MKFISSLDYECPYCHGQLVDEEKEGRPVRVCHSEMCEYLVQSRVFDIAEVGHE